MPFSRGAILQHDDGMHYGSSKRDTAGGVAGLNATGQVLALGNALLLTRDGLGNMVIIERTSGEVVLLMTRTGVGTFEFYVNESGAWKTIQTESMKNAASGIAGLDAGAQIAVAQAQCACLTGTYTGNASGAGRTIPHGLARTPRLIIITPAAVAGNPTLWVSGMGQYHQIFNGTQLYNLLTAPDATNFYVGNASDHMNENLKVYRWAVFG